ncbi:MAG: hypothetical protein QNJ36_19570 [Calothrix sp. MO_167.B42]|nr:hypothetical protein [Calothrix sp. MO_167.B42]
MVKGIRKFGRNFRPREEFGPGNSYEQKRDRAFENNSITENVSCTNLRKFASSIKISVVKY